MRVSVTPLTESRFDDFVGVIGALADFEQLERPDAAAVDRLRRDAFGPPPRFEAALAFAEDGCAVSYAIWFETYSSFLAKPTVYLEDLFVRQEARGSGAGGRLFDHVRSLGAARVRTDGVAGARVEHTGARVLRPAARHVDEGVAPG